MQSRERSSVQGMRTGAGRAVDVRELMVVDADG